MENINKQMGCCQYRVEVLGSHNAFLPLRDSHLRSKRPFYNVKDTPYRKLNGIVKHMYVVKNIKP